MGLFEVTIELGDPDGRGYEPIDTYVDTGAFYTTVPRSILERLHVKPHDKSNFVMADGRRVEMEIGRTWVRIGGKEEITLVVFGTENSIPVLGSYTLEAFRLGVDPHNKRLTEVESYLL